MESTRRILVICEGETERQYLYQWAEFCNALGKITIVVGLHSEPALLLEEGVKGYLWSQYVDEKPFTDVWVVFDRDSHRTFHKALKQKERFPFVHLCWSNPCIEAWFLMHLSLLPCFPRNSEVVLETTEEAFDEDRFLKKKTQTIEMTINPQTALSALKQKWPKYKKTGEKYLKTLKSGMDFALEQCTRIDLHSDIYAEGTLMPEILTDIALLATNDRDEAERKVGDKWHEYCEQKRLEAIWEPSFLLSERSISVTCEA